MSREIDAQVAKLLGWKDVSMIASLVPGKKNAIGIPPGVGRPFYDVPRYSTGWAACGDLLDWLDSKNIQYDLNNYEFIATTGRYTCLLSSDMEHYIDVLSEVQNDESLQMAVCLAVIEARKEGKI